MPWKQITWKKIEFTRPSVNADLFESLGRWFVQASQTYVHFTKKKNAIIVSKKRKKKRKKEQILIVETQKKTKFLHPFTPKTI